jgi:pseudouridine-5'-phosphate glycosidase
MSESTVMHRLQVLTNHMVSAPLRYMVQASTAKLTSEQVTSHLDVTSFSIHPDVKQALQKNGPVVALESTIISHGMPYPQNVQTAIMVENQVRKYGAVPATIAILDGVIHIGLNEEQLQKLGKLGQKCIKCSRRDIAVVCATKGNGATTVSATMILAQKAGIHVFVTGGIGGVHRGVQETMDISADLTELGRTPICVVSAGIKSILDIPRTLEYLETLGVTVGAYRTDEFPAFFTSKSGCKAQTRFEDADQCARVLLANLELQLDSGMIVAVPIPKDEEGKASKINKAIEKALVEMHKKGISGKDATPFLLNRVNELTGGESLRANIALVLNNAMIGAQIACSFSKLLNQA